MVQEGWYRDPQDSARLRYWDGAEWTEHTHDRPDDQGPPLVEEPATEATVSREAVKAPATMRWSTVVGRSPETAQPPPLPQAPPPALISQPPPPALISQPPPPAENHLPPPAETQPPPAPAQPPVVQEPEPDPELGLPTAHHGHLNDIGQWLERTFRIGLAKLAPSALLVALGFVPAVFFYALAYLALSEVTDDGGLQGTTVVMIVVLGLLFLMWMLWVGVVTLAQNHLLYQAHVGGQTSIGGSLQAGLQGVGRLAWAYLTLVAYLIMVVAVVGGLTFLFSLVSQTLGGVFFVVAYVAALTLTVWLGVKLSFLVVAAAVAPPGDRPMVVSVEATNGYFWAILGRLLLLGLILSAAVVPVLLVLGVVFGTSGTSFVSDPGSGTATTLIGVVAVGGVLYLLITMAVQVFSTSGIVRLYVDLGGPAQVERF